MPPQVKLARREKRKYKISLKYITMKEFIDELLKSIILLGYFGYQNRPDRSQSNSSAQLNFMQQRGAVSNKNEQ